MILCVIHLVMKPLNNRRDLPLLKILIYYECIIEIALFFMANKLFMANTLGNRKPFPVTGKCFTIYFAAFSLLLRRRGCLKF